jgi:copper chaperone CopZ
MKFLRSTITLLFILAVFPLSAQFISATVRIDGLTCSMCSNSVEKLIRKLDFVEDVKMDLNSNIAELSFKKGSKVEISKVASAVKDAGYSVGFLKASFYFDSLSVYDGFLFSFENNSYRFVSSGEKILNGLVTIQFLGKNFQEKKEFAATLSLYRTYLAEDKKKNVYYIKL